MRTLGNLIVEFRKVSHNDQLQGKDLIDRENFENLTKAIQNIHRDRGIKTGVKTSYWLPSEKGNKSNERMLYSRE